MKSTLKSHFLYSQPTVSLHNYFMDFTCCLHVISDVHFNYFAQKLIYLFSHRVILLLYKIKILLSKYPSLGYDVLFLHRYDVILTLFFK